MGYYSETKFERYVLRKLAGATAISKDDDHKKSKSDRRFRFKGREYTVQVKSVQTHSLKDRESRVVAVVQNDASDSRKVRLPTGRTITTTCYQVGEYDILAVPLYPFTGDWKDFAYIRNTDLHRSRYRKYTEEERACLLATTEPISWPLDPPWTTDLLSLLDAKVGRPVG